MRALARLRDGDAGGAVGPARFRWTLRALRVRSARERRRRWLLVGGMALAVGATLGRWLPVPLDLAMGAGTLALLGLAYRT